MRTAPRSARLRVVPRLAGRYTLLTFCAAAALACKGPSAPSGSRMPPSSFSLPIRVEQVDGSGGARLVPFGMPLAEHPNGHPGLDFFLVPGGDVLADQDGTISNISTSGEVGIDLKHADGWTSYFTGSFGRVFVSRGQPVWRGQVIATVAPHGGVGLSSYHWGTVDTDSKWAYCPADFLGAADRATLQRLLDESSFPDKAKYPLVCNPCPPGGCR